MAKTKGALLKELNEKTEKAKAWLQEKYIIPKWGYYDNLYRSIRVSTSKAEKWRSNVFIPLTFISISEIHPNLINGLIGQGDYYQILPTDPDDESKKKSANAFEHLIKVVNETGNFIPAINQALNYAERYGIGWIKCVWKYEECTKEYFDIKEGKINKVEDTDVEWDQPYYTAPNPRNVFFNCGAKADELEYIVELENKNIREIEKMKDSKVYISGEIDKFLNDKDKEKDEDIPTQKFTLATIYSKNNVYTVLEGRYIIRNHISPYKNRRGIPFFPLTYWPEDTLVGRGICELMSDINDHVNDIANMKADNLILSINKILVAQEDAFLPDESIRFQPGSISMLNDIDKIKTFEFGNVNPQAFTEMEQFQGIANRIAGSVAGVTSPDEVAVMNNKTATAAKLLVASMANKMSTIISANMQACIKPMMKWVIDMLQQYMSKDQALKLIGERRMKQLQLEEKNIDLEAKYDYIITGQDGLKSKEDELNTYIGLIELLGMMGAMDKLNVIPTLKRITQKFDIPKEIINTEEEEEIKPEEEKAPAQTQGVDVNTLSPQAKQELEVLAQQLGVPVEQIIEMVNSGQTTLQELVAQTQQAPVPQQV